MKNKLTITNEDNMEFLMPYNGFNGITIYCKNCGADFEETCNGYYNPIKHENDKYDRECHNCLKELGKCL